MFKCCSRTCIWLWSVCFNFVALKIDSIDSSCEYPKFPFEYHNLSHVQYSGSRATEDFAVLYFHRSTIIYRRWPNNFHVHSDVLVKIFRKVTTKHDRAIWSRLNLIQLSVSTLALCKRWRDIVLKRDSCRVQRDKEARERLGKDGKIKEKRNGVASWQATMWTHRWKLNIVACEDVQQAENHWNKMRELGRHG